MPNSSWFNGGQILIFQKNPESEMYVFNFLVKNQVFRQK